MFPDFSKMQADAAAAMKRAEERHVEMMKVQKEILFQLQQMNRLAHVAASEKSPPVVPA